MPLDYTYNFSVVLKEFNSSRNTDLNLLDIEMMRILATTPTGMQAMLLRRACGGDKNIFSATFNRGITGLIDAKYIQRKEHGKYVFYTITLQGRTAIAHLNEHLLQVVQGRIEQFNK